MDEVAPGPLRGVVLLALASHLLTGNLRTPTLGARAARMRVVEAPRSSAIGVCRSSRPC